MKKVAIVLGSVRPNRIADTILAEIQKELRDYPGLEVSIVDFREKPLPMFDGNTAPSSDGYAPTDDNVKAWIETVSGSDRILILSAEYNYSYPAALKNAIDWVPPAIWQDKPVSFIGYGWSGGSRAIQNTRALLTGFIQAKPSDREANLRFTKEIDQDGMVLDASTVKSSIREVLDEIAS
jgi:NAD(P)H-dependent FMN reductase